MSVARHVVIGTIVKDPKQPLPCIIQAPAMRCNVTEGALEARQNTRSAIYKRDVRPVLMTDVRLICTIDRYWRGGSD